MIAPRHLPDSFKLWNKKYGAPFGRQFFLNRRVQKVLPWRFWLRCAGYFSQQPNNTIREFEYPWAFFATPLRPGLRVLEIGGGLSGFQFVLDKLGCKVVNVDPGLNAKGNKKWACDMAMMTILNRHFGTSVELRNTTLADADLPSNFFDRAFSISVMEHLSDEELEQAMAIVHKCLKPGGFFILTVDLFPNLTPFTTQLTNEYGKNVNVHRLVEIAPFKLVKGEPTELYGYSDFNPDKILSNIKNYFVGRDPALAQCIVLQKANGSFENIE